MNWTKFSGIARVAMLAAALVALSVTVVTAAPAYADCGDPGQPACTGPAPTPDEVAGLLNQLTDPATPDPVKSGLVEGGLAPEELSDIDGHSNDLDGRGYLPLNFVVTDVEPAPNNYAGATVATAENWPFASMPPGPIVLVEQGGHWLITHDTAIPMLDALWHATRHRRPVVPVVVP